jgi:hypothetical protein
MPCAGLSGQRTASAANRRPAANLTLNWHDRAIVLPHHFSSRPTQSTQ